MSSDRLIVEIDLPTCTLVYGKGACGATGGVGSECYNSRATCQVPDDYANTFRVLRLCYADGGVTEAGIYPCIRTASHQAAEIQPEGAPRFDARFTFLLADFVDGGDTQDRYARIPTGTFFQRFVARYPSLAGATARVTVGSTLPLTGGYLDSTPRGKVKRNSFSPTPSRSSAMSLSPLPATLP